MSDGFCAHDYARHLGERGTRGPDLLSLHVHMPDHGSPCADGTRISPATVRCESGTRFLDALERELDLVGEHLGARPAAGGLHLGGGTPTRLDGAGLARLMHAFEARFDLHARAERTIEIDPRRVDVRHVAHLGELGFHRLRLDVRLPAPHTRQAIDGSGALAMTRTIIDCARGVGVHAVDVELACDLSHRNAPGVVAMLDRIVALQPERIVLVDVTGTVGGDACDARPSVGADARERLRRAGYVAIGLDHFAVPEDELAVAYRNGRLHRDIRGFTTRPDRDLLAFGPGAISDLHDCMAQNEPASDVWIHRIEAGGLPIARGLVRTPDDLLRSRLIQSLLCTGRIDIGSLEIDWLIDFRALFADELARLERFVADGLVLMDDESIEMTTTGRERALQTISAVFDRRGRGTVPRNGFPYPSCP